MAMGAMLRWPRSGVAPSRLSAADGYCRVGVTKPQKVSCSHSKEVFAHFRKGDLTKHTRVAAVGRGRGTAAGRHAFPSPAGSGGAACSRATSTSPWGGRPRHRGGQRAAPVHGQGGAQQGERRVPRPQALAREVPGRLHPQARQLPRLVPVVARRPEGGEPGRPARRPGGPADGADGLALLRLGPVPVPPRARRLHVHGGLTQPSAIPHGTFHAMLYMGRVQCAYTFLKGRRTHATCNMGPCTWRHRNEEGQGAGHGRGS